MLTAYLDSLWRLCLEAAPWLVLGLLLAGAIKAWLPEGVVARWLGGEGFWPVVKAALIGAPLPLCSCGVVPAALGLRRAGASRGATLSFLISTPETGADSVAISYALLGPFMTIMRPLAAVLSAVVTGLLAGLAWFAPPPPPPPPKVVGIGRFPIQIASAAPKQTSCGGGDCGCGAPAVPATPGWQRALGYAFGDILDDIAPWLLLGLLLAALLDTLIDPGQLAAFGSGLPAMLLMLLVGIPLYICATASTPLAASLLLAGVSPGTVLVFLLAGPATNLATLGIIRREMGERTLWAYLAGIAFTSLALGLATDALVGLLGVDIRAQLGVAGEWMPPWLAAGCVVLLLGAVVRTRLRRRDPV